MMKKPWLVAFVAALAALAVGCSSEKVRSDSGPSTTATKSTDATDGSSTTAAAAPSGPKTSPYLLVQGTVVVPPGEAGKLDVVFTGKPPADPMLGSSVPVVVANNTSDTLERIEITGTARAADGSLAGSGTSQGFQPARLAPGEWGISYVYFDTTIPADATIETTTTGEKAEGPGALDSVPLKVNELNFKADEYGGNYIGIVANEAKKTISTASLYLGCFDAASNLLDVEMGSTDGDVPAGGTASFSMSAPGDTPCAAVAVGASGYTF